MASDEKCIVAVSQLKLSVLSTEESTPPTSINVF